MVAVDQQPEDHQIRMSNSVMIQAKLADVKIPSQRFHLVDDYEELRHKMKAILNDFDVVLMSGGVSKGKADYVPQVLDELGVEKLFHRVAQRPGKPFWFGHKSNDTHVIALPGNPNFYLHVLCDLFSSVVEVHAFRPAFKSQICNFRREL